MDKQDNELYDKFKVAISGDVNHDQAVGFLANLNKQEYNRLIEIISDDQTTVVKPEAKDKILGFLKKIRDNIQ
jgi:hypothetical protein